MKYDIYKTIGCYSTEEYESLKRDCEEIWRETHEDEEPTEEDVTNSIYESVDTFYEDEKDNLCKTLDGRILAIASLGLWDGRKSGYKILGNRLYEVIDSFGCDDYEVYFDGHNIKSTCHHHDGTNCMEFREIRENRNIQNLLDKIYNGEDISRATINYYTKPLGKYVKEIYGW